MQNSSLKKQLVLKPIFGQGATILTAAVALAIGAGTVYSLSRSQPTKQSLSPTASARKAPIGAVAALGYLEPQGEVIKLSARAFMEGAQVDKLLVKRGDRVKAGQVFALLESRDRLQAALIQAREQVRVAQARLDQAEAGAKQDFAIANLDGEQLIESTNRIDNCSNFQFSKSSRSFFR